MGKFSFKKGDDDDNDSSRNALFGSRSSKNKSPAPPSQNPYAQTAVPPDAYTRAKMSAGVAQPPPGGFQQGNYGGGLPAPGQQRPGYGGGNPYAGGPPDRYGSDNKYGQSQGGQGGYGGGSGGGFSSDKFGNQNGYGGGSGGNPYASAQQTGGMLRQGGYGGLGPSNATEPDSNRDELFGGARERAEQRPQNSAGGPPGYQYNNPDGNAGGDRSYGAYGDRQLTAEEEEEEDITATKQEIRFMKQQDVASTRNALQIAAQAEEMGRNTLARLGAQGERMHNTDRNLDIGNNHVNVAEDKTKELKTLNRSMFAVHVNNPFTAKDRRAQRDEAIMDRHHQERELREASREQAFRSTQRMNQNFKGLDEAGAGTRTKTSLAERAKYQFEADSEDEGMENEIDRNLDDLTGAAKRLNLLARATGEEVEQQNKLINRIAEKVSVPPPPPQERKPSACNVQHANIDDRATDSTTDWCSRPRS
ncbi:synaptosomal-associated protein, 23kDa [Exophiala aquamarina CBS 119918]|uniref:Synaptosomal-associated protein, 23kDa n=1 Tax=Exophiala aquamarina CBS 119918 TaxID=1182545 RepID=A0A072PJS6_9EURO|nr:synaptosomal-associated protein, 23kDa [Exophiala aquamarina CBS 119918]KEF60017.1 synaptosomal-associated protein, 23kDa [Exophiala aquamarina CBS 119918]